jgi:hypothetical protein
MAITKSVIYYRLIWDHGSSRKVRRDQIKIAGDSLPGSIECLFYENVVVTSKRISRVLDAHS